MQTDNTFKINVIKMPLIDIIGVINTGLTFSFAFYFITLESSNAWRFTFDCIERVIFEGLLKPRVYIADQGLGLGAA
jgi:hypothetical protein